MANATNFPLNLIFLSRTESSIKQILAQMSVIL